MPQLIWRLPNSGKTIFLTFDDGPIPEVTPWVLDQLEKYKAKASFFCVGENIERNPDIYQMILNSSHTVCNHTHNHLSGWSTCTKDYIDNVDKASQFISSSFFRPPYGRLTPAKFKALKEKYQIVMWDVLSGDFDPYISPEDCLNNVIRNAQSGSIIVFHDSIKSQKNLEYTLPRMLEYFSALNYNFENLEFALSGKLSTVIE